MIERPNILLILSDEHDPSVTGCYGHPVVQTPHLDRMAREGVVFDHAYCNSPLCVPSRMSFLTGRYCHQIGVWDNGSPLKSEIPTFAHYSEAAGYGTVLCGRMHMIGEDRLHGFGRRLYDDITRWQSYSQTPKRTKGARRGSNSHVAECGPGGSVYQTYDDTVTDLTVRFLKSRAEAPDDDPWLLVSGLMCPHFPLIAPEAYFEIYDPDRIDLPDLNEETLESQHPVIRHLRRYHHHEDELPEELTRRALASYYALITMTDHNIGRMLEAIDSSRLRENTVVIYVSDHGEMGGQHGIWQKQCFYEPSVRVPMLVRTPDLPGGRRVDKNVSLVDCVPTILELAGLEVPGGLPGKGLTGYLDGMDNSDQIVLSEYHAQGMLNAGFMIKTGDFKYNYYVGHGPQLFNVKEDPGEFRDLSQDPVFRHVQSELHEALCSIVDPEAVDASAKENQKLEGIRRAY